MRPARAADLRCRTRLAVARRHVEHASGPSAARRRILAFLDEHPDALHRSCAPGHLTASAIVLDASRTKVALVFHRKVRRWLQPGGHADGEANLALVALKEATEETGIAGLRIYVPGIDVDVHRFVRADGLEPDHWHLDVRFLALAPAGAVPVNNDESEEARWFDAAELRELDLDPSTRRLVRAALAVSPPA